MTLSSSDVQQNVHAALLSDSDQHQSDLRAAVRLYDFRCFGIKSRGLLLYDTDLVFLSFDSWLNYFFNYQWLFLQGLFNKTIQRK